MPITMACQTLILADEDLDEKVKVYYDEGAGRVVIRPKAGVALGLGPDTIGLKWDGGSKTWIRDIELVFNGPIAQAARPVDEGPHSEQDVIVAIGSLTIQDRFNYDRAVLRWLPVEEQAAAGRSYGVDVVELDVLDALTGVVLTGGADVDADSHVGIHVSAGPRYYPFA
jgi:hypothetical protein